MTNAEASPAWSAPAAGSGTVIARCTWAVPLSGRQVVYPGNHECIYDLAYAMKKFTYKHTQRPKYLEGCFYWKGRGYHYPECLPTAIISADELPMEDPWIALSWVLERAKSADFSHVSRLRHWILDQQNDPTLVSACLGITADAGLDDDLEFLAELMLEGPNYLRIEASLAAQWSGVLWLVPFMLEAWRALSRRADRTAIETDIVNLLDPMHGEPRFFASGLSDVEYTRAVDARLVELKAALGDDGASISGGAAVDMNQQVWLMRKALVSKDSAEWIDWGSFLVWRRKFEVYSGVDCSRFYGDGGMFQPREASGILDRYLVSPMHFDVGERYFFGHLLPRRMKPV